VQADGSDGCDFLRGELACYRILAERNLGSLSPALIEALDVQRKVILVLEYINGISLLHARLNGQLTVEQFDRSGTMIEQFHAQGVYLGDAKIANFLITEDGDLRALDFEAAGIVGDGAPPVRTFFVRSEPGDPFAADRAHFLASVLYPYERGRYS
jgi:serine/threonine protein kinase